MLHVSNLTKHFGDTPILRDVSFTLAHGERAGTRWPQRQRQDHPAAHHRRPRTSRRRLRSPWRPARGRAICARALWATSARRLARCSIPHGAVWPAHLALQQCRRRGAGRSAAQTPRRWRVLRAGRYTLRGAWGIPAAGRRRGGFARARSRRPRSGAHRRLRSAEGQKTRLALAALLLGAPDLLLLDEPTNHLDVDALRWLEGFITRYHGAVLLVSHDRAFLDATVETCWNSTTRTHGITAYPGGYSAYAAAKAGRDRGAVGGVPAPGARARAHRTRISGALRSRRAACEAKTQADYRGETRGAKAGRAYARHQSRAQSHRARAQAGDEPSTSTRWRSHRPAGRSSSPSRRHQGGAREVLRADGLRKSFGGHTVSTASTCTCATANAWC